jgi:hypothetical protein
MKTGARSSTAANCVDAFAAVQGDQTELAVACVLERPALISRASARPLLDSRAILRGLWAATHVQALS